MRFHSLVDWQRFLDCPSDPDILAELQQANLKRDAALAFERQQFPMWRNRELLDLDLADACIIAVSFTERVLSVSYGLATSLKIAVVDYSDVDSHSFDTSVDPDRASFVLATEFRMPRDARDRVEHSLLISKGAKCLEHSVVFSTARVRLNELSLTTATEEL